MENIFHHTVLSKNKNLFWLILLTFKWHRNPMSAFSAKQCMYKCPTEGGDIIQGIQIQLSGKTLLGYMSVSLKNNWGIWNNDVSVSYMSLSGVKRAALPKNRKITLYFPPTHCFNKRVSVHQRQTLLCTISSTFPKRSSLCVPGRPFGSGANHKSYLISMKGALSQRFCSGHIW